MNVIDRLALKTERWLDEGQKDNDAMRTAVGLRHNEAEAREFVWILIGLACLCVGVPMSLIDGDAASVFSIPMYVGFALFIWGGFAGPMYFMYRGKKALRAK